MCGMYVWHVCVARAYTVGCFCHLGMLPSVELFMDLGLNELWEEVSLIWNYHTHSDPPFPEGLPVFGAGAGEPQCGAEYQEQTAA